MEEDDAPTPRMFGNPSEHRRRLALEHENVAADDGVEGPVERHFGRISLAEDHVAKGSGIRSLSRRCQSGRRSVCPDDFAPGSDKVCQQEGDIAGTAADVEHAHPGDDPGGGKKPPRDRINETRLLVESVELPIRMAKNIQAGRPRVVPHVYRFGTAIVILNPSGSVTDISRLPRG
jgi:hypothetical protein